MAHPRITNDDVVQRGKELYERCIRAKVETAENIGKIVSIDVESGDYEVGDGLISTGDRLLARHPNAVLYGARIGYDAVYAL